MDHSSATRCPILTFHLVQALSRRLKPWRPLITEIWKQCLLCLSSMQIPTRQVGLGKATDIYIRSHVDIIPHTMGAFLAEDAIGMVSQPLSRMFMAPQKYGRSLIATTAIQQAAASAKQIIASKPFFPLPATFCPGHGHHNLFAT